MLEKIWKEEIPKAYDDKHYVADLTSKERGQLKNFISRIGAAAKADEVLTYLIHNWYGFGEKISGNSTHKVCYPNNPKIALILQYTEDAVNYFIDKDKPEIPKIFYNPFGNLK